MITDQLQKCCGCFACEAICPKKAISLYENKEGFLYPRIDEKKCIKCGLCDKCCPLSNNLVFDRSQKGFVVKAIDKNIRNESSSGGFVTEITLSRMKANWACYAVRFDDSCEYLKTCKIDLISNVSKYAGSKYIQSNMSGVFEMVEDDLRNNIKVLFVGTSCQLNGLVNVLKIKKVPLDNFYSIDLICHGVSSPEVWRQYKKIQEKKYHSKITYANFRYKRFGYHSSSMKLQFDNEKCYYGSGRVDMMLKSFFSEISSRKCCYNCNFKDKNRISDITAFDGWHFKALTGLLDDDKGYTNIIVNSSKGEELINYLTEELSIFNSDVETMIELDGSMYRKSAIENPNRDAFLSGLKDNGLEKQIKRFIPITLKDKTIELLKNVYYMKRRIK